MQHIPTIGFISPPAWFDPAPAEFLRVVVERVRTQQAPLLLPNFDYRLDHIAQVQSELNLCGQSLAAMGCDIVAQVGTPFAWAGVSDEQEARSRKAALAKAAGVPAVMTGLAIVDGLRALGAQRIALNCTYYERDWRDSLEAFLTACSFEVSHASTLVDQGLVSTQANFADYGWSMTDQLTRKSILTVAEMASNAEAVVVTGAGTRTLKLLAELETTINRPIIAADTVLYWAIAKQLGLTLQPVMGRLANL